MNREDEKFLINLIRSAGNEIMTLYTSQSYSVEKKQDSSPLTDADKASHTLIVSELMSRFSYPILSEEDPVAYDVRKSWSQFWLLDPLDGTKDFVERTGDFTVNLALIDNASPVLGLIGVPSDGRVYYAERGVGAFCHYVDKETEKLQRLPMTDFPGRCVESRFHTSKAVLDFKRAHKIHESVQCGSAIKFCSIAEGKADVYPRLSPTSEWDTAAGQVLVELAGAELVDLSTGKALQYNKESTLNPDFVVKDPEFKILDEFLGVSN